MNSKIRKVFSVIVFVLITLGLVFIGTSFNREVQSPILWIIGNIVWLVFCLLNGIAFSRNIK